LEIVQRPARSHQKILIEGVLESKYTETAVDGDALPGDIAGCRHAQKSDHPGTFFYFPDATHRCALQHLTSVIRILQHLVRQWESSVIPVPFFYYCFSIKIHFCL